jgi:GT2 family glycosyltransferase
MNVTVLVATYRRPRDVERCLAALWRQTKPANQVLLVVREDDDDTIRWLQDSAPEAACVRRLTVTEPGVVAALNKGLEEARSEIVAIIDDDAAPHPDWLARIQHHFDADPTIGGVGGRDCIVRDGKPITGQARVIGKVQWFGRVIGNHHLGVGAPREVDVLKGVNMSFRRTAIEGLQLDQRLRGRGAQVDWEIAFCLEVKRGGWRLVYDPAISVDHFPGERHDADQRSAFSAEAVADATHNQTLILLEHLPPLRRIAFMVWMVVVGTSVAPGLLQWVRLILRGDPVAGARTAASLRGRREGMKTWRRNRLA